MGCQHCGYEVVCRPRGLCWNCFADRRIRELYAPVTRAGDYGALVYEPPQLEPATPCPHPVGSPERIATYASRAEAGEKLWHPEDSRTVAELPNKGGRRGK